MTTSAQFLYSVQQHSTSKVDSFNRPASTNLARRGVAPQVWQTLVLLGELENSPVLRHEQVTYARFDTAHHAIPQPWLLAQWSEDIGWHRSLAELKPAIQPRNAVTRDTNAGATVELREANSPRAETSRPYLKEAAKEVVKQVAVDRSRHFQQILAEAAHDIRSPIAVAQQILTSIALRVPAGSVLNDQESQLLRQANLRLTQAIQWAEGILLGRSLERGGPVNVRRRFYPHQWRAGIEPLLQSLAALRDVRLRWSGWDRSLPRLYLDPTHLSRIVLNLVTNAVQASPAGGDVHVRVAWLTNITQQLVISIEDQGSGLPNAVLHKMNVPAARTGSDLHNPHFEPHDGGIGLMTAKTLTLGMCGSLLAQTSHSGGTRFSLTLPVDNYHSLIRGWLRQNAERDATDKRGQRQQLTIHAVRGQFSPPRDVANEEARALARQLDGRFQQAAEVNDLVYRVAHDRWLWLSLVPYTSSTDRGIYPQADQANAVPAPLAEVLKWCQQHHPRHGDSNVCRQQQVFRLENVWPRTWLGANSSQHNLLSITSLLAERIAELIGNHIPPIDQLDLEEAPDPLWSESKIRVKQLRQDPAQLAPTPVLRFDSRPKTDTAPADTPSETFSDAMAELSQQWYARQQRLDQTHWVLSSKSRATPVHLTSFTLDD